MAHQHVGRTRRPMQGRALWFVVVLQCVVSTAFAQVKVLPSVLINVCGPELEASSRCQRGEVGLATLRGSQLRLVQGLAKLSVHATVSDVQRVVGPAAVEDEDAGAALLDGKPVRRRIARWNLSWEPALGRTEPMDRVLVGVFANGLLMNLQVGGVAIPRAGLYFAGLECDPDCATRLRPMDGAQNASSRAPSSDQAQFGPTYAAQVVRAIKGNIHWKEGEPPDGRCEVEVELNAQGHIVARRVAKAEGHPEWCPTVLRALDRTERIPLDVNGRVPPRMVIVFNGRE